MSPLAPWPNPPPEDVPALDDTFLAVDFDDALVAFTDARFGFGATFAFERVARTTAVRGFGDAAGRVGTAATGGAGAGEAAGFGAVTGALGIAGPAVFVPCAWAWSGVPNVATATIKMPKRTLKQVVIDASFACPADRADWED